MAASPVFMNSKKPVIFLWSLTVKCCINIVDNVTAVIFILSLLGPFTEASSGKSSGKLQVHTIKNNDELLQECSFSKHHTDSRLVGAGNVVKCGINIHVKGQKDKGHESPSVNQI